MSAVVRNKSGAHGDLLEFCILVGCWSHRKLESMGLQTTARNKDGFDEAVPRAMSFVGFGEH
jgi:hypothetical protein